MHECMNDNGKTHHVVSQVVADVHLLQLPELAQLLEHLLVEILEVLHRLIGSTSPSVGCESVCACVRVAPSQRPSMHALTSWDAASLAPCGMARSPRWGGTAVACAGLTHMCFKSSVWEKGGRWCCREQRSPWRQAPILK